MDPAVPTLLRAEWLVLDASHVLRDGALAIAGGRVQAVFAGAGAARRWAQRAGARSEESSEGVLAPGWVNAHAHLELSHLRHRLPAGEPFPRWIGRLLAFKQATAPADWPRAVRLGVHRLLATGTTLVGDIDSVSLPHGDLAGPPIAARIFREALDMFQPDRLESAARVFEMTVRGGGLRTYGLAPHASFSASPALLARAARVQRRERIPVTIHWSETEDELAWLARGGGALASWLPASPRRTGLDLLAEAGLLGAGTSLVHANFPGRGEPERIARAGATVVHCPGSHAFFGRAPFPLATWRKAGVPVALGTDSWASNADLHMGREVALLRRHFSDLAPEPAFEMATEHGARALGFGGERGRLWPGAWADVVRYSARAEDPRGVLERLTTETLEPSAVRVAGTPVVLEALIA
ncbi:MAG: amidohydrolase family protein [Planctomycetota bacterium]